MLSNPTALQAFPHAMAGGWILAGTLVAGISGWWMIRTKRAGDEHGHAAGIWRSLTRFGSWIILLGTAAITITGDALGKLMFIQQPMKMASAEALCHTEMDPSFSILAFSRLNNCETAQHLIDVPYVLSFLAKGKFSGVELRGVTEMQQYYESLYGPGNYMPNLFVTYWSFRLMIGFLIVPCILALVALWTTRKGRVPTARWMGIGALLALPAPWLSNFAGWIFTEMGRQPWIVAPNPEFQEGNFPGGEEKLHLIVDLGVSDHPEWVVWTSLLTFTALYGVLAVVWFWLMQRYARAGLDQPGLRDGEEKDLAAALYGPGEDSELAPLSFSSAQESCPGGADASLTENNNHPEEK